MRVQATLYYQATPPYFLKDKFQTQGPNSQRLQYLAGHLDLSATPMANWKLAIASGSGRP